MINRIKKLYFSSDINISNLLRKKAILFENVKRENCKIDLILKYFELKGLNIKKDDVHIMTNILSRPTGRIMILVDNMKKQNFNFDFDNIQNNEDNGNNDSKIENYNSENNNNIIKNNENDVKLLFNENEEEKEVYNKANNNISNDIIINKKYHSNLKNLFMNCKIHLCDDYEIEKFVEECERFFRFTEDIKRISKFENLDKIVTIINIPNCYGRKELSEIIYECANIKVKLKNIIFRFKKNGSQSDCAYVLCDHINDANILINKMQEYPVAKKYHLKEFYGTSFLYASKNNLFISSEKLDYLTIFSKYKIFTCGWHKDISLKEFENFLITLKIFPCKIIKINYNNKESDEKIIEYNSDEKNEKDSNKYELSEINHNHISINVDEFTTTTNNNNSLSEQNNLNTSSFILFFENMRMTKKVFTKLERLKKKWKISTTSNFYAYPKIPDIHFNDEENYTDENEYEDSDLDEEIEY
ncbi:conserved Plasmodium protein, unknown function [Plasmodium gallinaceum]|uniref:Uncharacterized protein n=1 Tax=Plasmodium gallinaceum TaxID=5849 RepID=A0A1J1GZL4_PLAGA|nr:conserved Plasmodium protein, unknown function [Plasmodium gallinaceum]CRG97665.1 conserved Plasmodium protein, unknown function [Plasmodium gallinaceum]